MSQLAGDLIELMRLAQAGDERTERRLKEVARDIIAEGVDDARGGA